MSAFDALVAGVIARWPVGLTDESEQDKLAAAINRISQGIVELMATSKILVAEMDGTPKQIVFADHAGDFSPASASDLRKTTDGSQNTNVQLSLASLSNGSYRQSAKFDFGAVRAEEYKLRGVFKHGSTPTAGNAHEAWLSPSHSVTAGNGNAAGASGTDSAYAGYSSNAAAAILQAQFIAPGIVTTQTTTITIIEFGIVRPTERYASLIFKNGSGAALHTDDVEIHLVLDPIIPQSQ